jgi:hypothetical protein
MPKVVFFYFIFAPILKRPNHLYMQPIKPYQPQHKIRIVTAASFKVNNRYNRFFITIFFMLVVALAFSCKNSKEEPKFNERKATDLFPNLQAIKDTLNRFDKFDRLFYSQDLAFNLCIDEFEGKRIGIFSYRGLYVFLRREDKDWELITKDTTLYDPMYRGLCLEDINGDGFDDIKGTNGFGGHGATLSFFALYNPESKTFKYNPFYDGGYVMYDKCSNLVCKYYDQPTYAHKERYKIIGDSLAIIDEVSFHASGFPTNDCCRTVHKTYKNGKVISKKIIRNNEQEYFEKALWDYAQW